MEIVIIALAIIIVLLLAVVLVKSFQQKTNDMSPQMIDLRNQLEDLKVKQVEGQTSSLTQQQQLLLETQKMLGDQLGQIMKNVNDVLTSSHGSLNTQLKASNEVIGDIQKKLGSLEATTKNIQEIGKDISSLQEIL
jgi:uncharacterized protein YoxC